MTKPFNPLFDKLPTTADVQQTQQEIVASMNNIPLSPSSGQPMQLAYIGDIPVFADLANRIVFPVRD
jgi:hypothetical protein